MKVTAHVNITGDRVYRNGELYMQLEGKEEANLKELYQKLELSYPKFYKMDGMSKLSILSFKLLSEVIPMEQYSEEDVSLIFANAGASHRTDLKFIDSYENTGMPSPSLFVYTLPNILTGELSIYQKWFGENIFFVEEKFNPSLFIEQINLYFRKGASACLCGWIESFGSENNAKLWMVEPSEEELTTTDLNTLLNYE